MTAVVLDRWCSHGNQTKTKTGRHGDVCLSLLGGGGGCAIDVHKMGFIFRVDLAVSMNQPIVFCLSHRAA